MTTLRDKKPGGLMRLFLRMPIWLYRLRLGWLLGRRFVMFRHIGRKSGLPRYVVVEVVHYDPPSGTYTIASGWGEKSDWFQNVQQTPKVVLYTGRQRLPARATRLPVDEAARTLTDYAALHPTAFRTLSKAMVGTPLEANAADCRRLAEVVPLVTLTPAQT